MIPKRIIPIPIRETILAIFSFWFFSSWVEAFLLLEEKIIPRIPHIPAGTLAKGRQQQRSINAVSTIDKMNHREVVDGLAGTFASSDGLASIIGPASA